MKKNIYFLISITFLSQLYAQNTMKNITPSGTSVKKEGYLQKSLDKWMTNDWDKTHETIRKEEKKQKPQYNVKSEPAKKSEATDSFTLQHYVDKWDRYLREKEKGGESSPSHYRKMQHLPAIGEGKKRR